MSDSTELAIIPKETALTVFSADNGLDPYLEKIKQEVAAFVPDITTKKGRDAIASMAYKVSQSKTYLDKTGKELVDELKDIPKKIDAERKRMREMLDALRDSVRQPLTDWENAEKERVDRLKTGLELITQSAQGISEFSSDTLRTSIAAIEANKIDDSWQEFELQAHKAKEDALVLLNDALVKRLAYEAEQEELARLREEAAVREQKEREERIAREAAEAERLKAAQAAAAEIIRVEQAAQAERDAVAKREAEAKAAAERRELELKLAAEQAKREAAEAEQRAVQAAQAERDRIAAEKAKEEADLKAREKDKEHKKAINNAALAAFTNGGMTEACAKMAITLIAKGSIPSVKIQY